MPTVHDPARPWSARSAVLLSGRPCAGPCMPHTGCQAATPLPGPCSKACMLANPSWEARSRRAASPAPGRSDSRLPPRRQKRLRQCLHAWPCGMPPSQPSPLGCTPELLGHAGRGRSAAGRRQGEYSTSSFPSLALCRGGNQGSSWPPGSTALVRGGVLSLSRLSLLWMLGAEGARAVLPAQAGGGRRRGQVAKSSATGRPRYYSGGLLVCRLLAEGGSRTGQLGHSKSALEPLEGGWQGNPACNAAREARSLDSHPPATGGSTGIAPIH